jgi:hypothetical protein
MLFGGRYRIAGTVDELGTVGRYRVRLFDRSSARCIREIWSDPHTGAYSFEWLTNRDYFAVAFDHGENPGRPGIRDFVTPELMP